MRTWWRQIVGRARADRELAREVEAHIAERVDDLVEGPVIYQPLRAANFALVRDLSPGMSARVRELVQAAVPGASSYSRPMVEELRDSLTGLVVGSRIAWVLGLLALLQAMLGAFGVFASMVEERRREIGVRMALGAHGSQVMRLVLHRATRPVLAGLAAGVALSLIATPFAAAYALRHESLRSDRIPRNCRPPAGRLARRDVDSRGARGSRRTGSYPSRRLIGLFAS